MSVTTPLEKIREFWTFICDKKKKTNLTKRTKILPNKIIKQQSWWHNNFLNWNFDKVSNNIFARWILFSSVFCFGSSHMQWRFLKLMVIFFIIYTWITPRFYLTSPTICYTEGEYVSCIYHMVFIIRLSTIVFHLKRFNHTLLILCA